MSLSLFLVDDHESITDCFKNYLGYFYSSFKTEVANTLHSAYEIVNSNIINDFDIALLDISMPPYKEKQINNGIDLAMLIRSKIPTIKIIFVTGPQQLETIQKAIKTIAPEGFVDKIDINGLNFKSIIDAAIDGEVFVSNTIQNILDERLTKGMLFDSINIKIVTLIAQGIATKNLKDHLSISTSAIDKRKAIIKQILDMEKGTDEDIIREARKRKMI